MPTDNAKGEEYLTDVIAILRAEGHHVASVTLEDPDEVLGVNDRAQLARARQIFNARLLRSWMGAGVTWWTGRRLDRYRGEPGPRRRDGPGPARGLHRGGGGGPGRPGAQLRDTTVGVGATVIQFVCRGADIGAGAVVGPFAYLPRGSKVEAGGSAEGTNKTGIADGQPTGRNGILLPDPGGPGPGGQSPAGRAPGGGRSGGQDAATSEEAQQA